MLEEKGRRLAKTVFSHHVLTGLCSLLLVFLLSGCAFPSTVGVQPEIMIMGSDVQTYDLDATSWEFPLALTGFGTGNGTATMVEFSIDGRNLLQLIPEAQRTLPVHRLDNEIDRESFRKWLEYRRRIAVLRVRNDEQAAFSAAEEQDFRELMERVQKIGKLRDISPGIGGASNLVVNVASLPFRVTADGRYKVRIAVEQGQLRAGWEGEILIVDVEPLDLSLVWAPPSLHSALSSRPSHTLAVKPYGTLWTWGPATTDK